MFGIFRILLLLLLSAVVCQAADMPDAIRWIPRDAIICVEVSEPRAVLSWDMADDEDPGFSLGCARVLSSLVDG